MHHTGGRADGLLAAWTALWHPALWDATQAAPNWYRADTPPDNLEHRLLMVPGIAEEELPVGFVDRARKEGAVVILGDRKRSQIVAEVLAPMNERARQADPELVADFFALGYCYLQVELLTRQMRYSTCLDEVHFFQQVVQGATAVMEDRPDRARDQLHACFDLLAQERDHYYAVDAYLIDITLIAPTRVGSPLATELRHGHVTNLLCSASDLECIKETAPLTFSAIQEGVKEDRVGLIGGDAVELRSGLLAAETVLGQLHAGRDLFRDLIRAEPSVYGRRTFGFSILSAQLLHQFGCQGALHATLGHGHLPEGRQVKVRWEGHDKSSLDILSRTPHDAGDPETFLALASKLGETMDMDHVATLCLAHWPGHACTWHEDLLRTARYGAVLGKLVTVEQYFRDTDYAGQVDQFHADQYESHYLAGAYEDSRKQAVSRTRKYWQHHSIASAAQTLDVVSQLVSNRSSKSVSDSLRCVDLAGDVPSRADSVAVATQELQRAADRLATLIPRQSQAPRRGYLLINSMSQVRRVGLELPELTTAPAIEKPVYSASVGPKQQQVVVDIPALGFVWLDCQSSTRTKPSPEKTLAEPGRLYNEFVDARIDPHTGALQGVYSFASRGNRMSQQLAVRRPRGGVHGGGPGNQIYSVMAADDVAVTSSTATLGEITSRGRLVDRSGSILARYQQRFRLWRGSRVIQIQIDLEPLCELESDPWESYFACRFAWNNESALLWRSVNQLRDRAESKRLEAPNYIDVDESSRCTTILTGGLPYHRRTSGRTLDSLLITSGEACRSFELGIAVDARNPLLESESLLTPVALVRDDAGPPENSPSGWLFHISNRAVVATAWEPLLEADKLVGFTVRLLETAGDPARAKLSAFRPVGTARQVDFHGQPLTDCTVDDGAVRVELEAHAWRQFEARWA